MKHLVQVVEREREAGTPFLRFDFTLSRVIILEARDRIGGRINTHFESWPIELGAEFVHGKPPETLQIAGRAQLKLQELPNRHWHMHNGVLTKSSEFWSKVEKVMDERLAMGQVVKVVMRFREPFWEDSVELKDLTFIHAVAETLPTWWTQFPVRAPLLVGWAGGTRADRLSLESDDALLDLAFESLSHILGTSKSFLEQSLVEFYTHNWHKDPFSAGAYSYIPVGGLDAQARLAQPLEDTLFFAGEATNTEGHHGTVHGAIATGLRAAREIAELDR